MALEHDVDWSFLDGDYPEQKGFPWPFERRPLFNPGRVVVTDKARAR